MYRILSRFYFSCWVSFKKEGLVGDLQSIPSFLPSFIHSLLHMIGFSMLLNCINIELLITGPVINASDVLINNIVLQGCFQTVQWICQIHLARWMGNLCITSYFLFPPNPLCYPIIKFHLTQCFGLLVPDIKSKTVVNDFCSLCSAFYWQCV